MFTYTVYQVENRKWNSEVTEDEAIMAIKQGYPVTLFSDNPGEINIAEEQLKSADIKCNTAMTKTGRQYLRINFRGSDANAFITNLKSKLATNPA